MFGFISFCYNIQGMFAVNNKICNFFFAVLLKLLSPLASHISLVSAAYDIFFKIEGNPSPYYEVLGITPNRR